MKNKPTLEKTVKNKLVPIIMLDKRKKYQWEFEVIIEPSCEFEGWIQFLRVAEKTSIK